MSKNLAHKDLEINTNCFLLDKIHALTQASSKCCAQLSDRRVFLSHDTSTSWTQNRGKERMSIFQLLSSGLGKTKKKASITTGEDTASILSLFPVDQVVSIPTYTWNLSAGDWESAITTRTFTASDTSRAGSIFGLFAVWSPTDHSILNITRKFN